MARGCVFALPVVVVDESCDGLALSPPDAGVEGGNLELARFLVPTEFAAGVDVGCVGRRSFSKSLRSFCGWG